MGRRIFHKGAAVTTWAIKLLTWPRITLFVLGGLILFMPLPMPAYAPQAREFTIEASRFAYTPAILKVNPGDQVTVKLKSLDVVHGLTIDGYSFDLQAEPGQPGEIKFTAGATGVYRMRCSVTCGNMHPFMLGKIQVGRNDLLWRTIVALAVLVLGLLAWKRT